MFTNAFGFGSALVGSAPTASNPNAVAVDQATHTIYVANGFSDDTANGLGDTVSVIDSRQCDARDVSRCRGPWPTITVGDRTLTDDPSGIAIDEQTDTVYVSNAGPGTVSVFNGATCNALVPSGCDQTPATVPVGNTPAGLYADASNHTVYVPNLGDTTVSMLDTATCNATHLAACPTSSPPAVDVGPGTPDNVDADPATHTVYVTTFGATRAENGWAVFDANTCNATVQTACGQLGRLQGPPSGPGDAEVDTVNDTLYTANFDNTVSAFDLRDCRAGDLAGCASQSPGTVTPWPNPGFNENDVWVAVDTSLHSVYAVYARDDVLVVVDTDVCNGRHLSACARVTNPPTIHTGALPEAVVLDGDTQTLYTANQFDNDISVIDATRCNAQDTTGCRRRPPDVSIPQPGGVAYDNTTHTAYVASAANTVAMIDTQACNAHHPAGCTTTPRSVTVGEVPVAIAIDHRTHTVYVANYGSGRSGTVSVLDSRTCDATRTAGCATLATLPVAGGHPDDLVLNPVTGTLYVATITNAGPNLLSVFKTATCNAADTRGCRQTATLPLGDSGDGFSVLTVAIDDATNTVYATNLVTEQNNPVSFTGSSVYVINAATCDATDTAGCSQIPRTIIVPANNLTNGSTPVGVAVDQATDTIYAADLEGGDVREGHHRGRRRRHLQRSGHQRLRPNPHDSPGRFRRRRRRDRPDNPPRLRQQHRGQQRLHTRRRHLQQPEHSRLQPHPAQNRCRRVPGRRPIRGQPAQQLLRDDRRRSRRRHRVRARHQQHLRHPTRH